MQAIINRTLNTVEKDAPLLTLKVQNEIIGEKGKFIFNRKTRKYESPTENESERNSFSDYDTFHDAQDTTMEEIQAKINNLIPRSEEDVLNFNKLNDDFAMRSKELESKAVEKKLEEEAPR
jgi:hypothetical protein